MAAGRQPASDHGGRHADRPLPLRQPAQDVAAVHSRADGELCGRHRLAHGLGAAGSLLGHVYDWARGTDRYQNLTHDHGYAQENRHVVPEPCAQLGMKVALGLAVAWAASSIAPGIIDATNASTEMKLVTFAWWAAPSMRCSPIR